MVRPLRYLHLPDVAGKAHMLLEDRRTRPGDRVSNRGGLLFGRLKGGTKKRQAKRLPRGQGEGHLRDLAWLQAWPETRAIVRRGNNDRGGNSRHNKVLS